MNCFRLLRHRRQQDPAFFFLSKLSRLELPKMTWQLRLYLRGTTRSLSLFLTSYHPFPPFPRQPLSIWEDHREQRGLPQSTRFTSMKHVGAGRGADSPGILAFRLSQMLPVWWGWCQGWWGWHEWQEQRLVRGTDEQMQHVKQHNTQSRGSGMNITLLQIVSLKKNHMTIHAPRGDVILVTFLPGNSHWDIWRVRFTQWATKSLGLVAMWPHEIHLLKTIIHDMFL